MDKTIIQITSGRGPEECTRVVAKVQEYILKQARANAIRVEVADTVPGDIKGTLRSATIMAYGKVYILQKEWEGTVQWIAQSPYRKMHKRKNWFVGVRFFPVDALQAWKENDVVFETCRASGPGGQNVNKVETAVRGRHIPSGIQVLTADTRSQLQNKKLCKERLKEKVELWYTRQLTEAQQDRWQEHNVLERGNPVKTVKAPLV